MANRITSQTIEPSTITITGELMKGTEELVVAHGMCEAYLGKDMPVSLVTVSYAIDEPRKPLPTVEDYPLNHLETVIGGHTQTPIEGVTVSDKYIFNGVGDWPATVVVQYRGGIPPQVFDAIVRQARVLADRDDRAPECMDWNIGRGALDKKQNPQYRTGLPSDVKHMLFPYKTIGF